VNLKFYYIKMWRKCVKDVCVTYVSTFFFFFLDKILGKICLFSCFRGIYFQDVKNFL
jgi:hypothetical protein